MNPSLKRFNVALVLAVVLALVLVQVPRTYSAELTAPEKALAFLTDVVRLDMTKYNAKLVSVPDFLSDFDDLIQERVKYTLESDVSKIDVICNFRNNALVWCKLYVLEGSPLFAQPSTNVLDAAKGFLDRHQAFSRASYLQPMRDMLNTVTELKPITTTVGDVELKITISSVEDFVHIQWTNTPNGIHNPYNKISLMFRNGAFMQFSDNWNRYPIGSSDVNISKEEAINIAKKRVQSFSYEFGNLTVSNLTVADKPEFIFAELTMQPRENALYPHWEIVLPLDKVYPGMTTGIRVLLWADTGEVSYIKATGPLGIPPVEETPTEPPPDDSTGKTGLDPTPILIAVPIVLAIILGVAFYRRKRLTSSKHLKSLFIVNI